LQELPILKTKPFIVIHRIMEIILVASSAIIVILVSTYVVTRYILKINFNGFEEICILIIVWMYFIGSANASREQSHIAADMLALFVKNPNIKKRLQFFYRIVGLVVLGFMLYLSIDFMTFNMGHHAKTIILKWPLYLYHASMVAGFALMFFYDICHTIEAFIEIRHLGTVEIPAEESGETV
jgi:TRAP-type C4-dicarboxylate transport system permease small subunit